MRANPNAMNSVSKNKDRKALNEYIRINFRQVVQLFSQFSPFQIDKMVGRVVASLLMADIVFQIKRLDNNSFKFSGGHDRYQLMNENGFIIDDTRLPEIKRAFEKSIGIRVSSNSNALDSFVLRENIGIDNDFPFIAGFFPIFDNLGFILMSPYSNIDWDDHDLDFFVYCVNSLFVMFFQIQDYYQFVEGATYLPNIINSRSNHLNPDEIKKIITRLEDLQ